MKKVTSLLITLTLPCALLLSSCSNTDNVRVSGSVYSGYGYPYYGYGYHHHDTIIIDLPDRPERPIRPKPPARPQPVPSMGRPSMPRGGGLRRR